MSQVLQEAGVKLGGPEDGMNSVENQSGSEEGFGAEVRESKGDKQEGEKRGCVSKIDAGASQK